MDIKENNKLWNSLFRCDIVLYDLFVILSKADKNGIFRLKRKKEKRSEKHSYHYRLIFTFVKNENTRCP